MSSTIVATKQIAAIRSRRVLYFQMASAGLITSLVMFGFSMPVVGTINALFRAMGLSNTTYPQSAYSITALGLAMVSAWLLVRFRQTLGRTPVCEYGESCTGCGYDLKGLDPIVCNIVKCPECGDLNSLAEFTAPELTAGSQSYRTEMGSWRADLKKTLRMPRIKSKWYVKGYRTVSFGMTVVLIISTCAYYLHVSYMPFMRFVFGYVAPVISVVLLALIAPTLLFGVRMLRLTRRRRQVVLREIVAHSLNKLEL